MESQKKGEFLALISIEDIPIPKSEYAFSQAIGRKHRFDFAWPEVGLALELEGGLYNGRGHGGRERYLTDLDKYNLAAQMGWTVLRYTYSSAGGPDCVSLTSRLAVRQVLDTYQFLVARLLSCGQTSFAPRMPSVKEDLFQSISEGSRAKSPRARTSRSR